MIPSDREIVLVISVAARSRVQSLCDSLLGAERMTLPRVHPALRYRNLYRRNHAIYSSQKCRGSGSDDRGRQGCLVAPRQGVEPGAGLGDGRFVGEGAAGGPGVVAPCLPRCQWRESSPTPWAGKTELPPRLSADAAMAMIGCEVHDRSCLGSSLPWRQTRLDPARVAVAYRNP